MGITVEFDGIPDKRILAIMTANGGRIVDGEIEADIDYVVIRKPANSIRMGYVYSRLSENANCVLVARKNSIYYAREISSYLVFVRAGDEVRIASGFTGSTWRFVQTSIPLAMHVMRRLANSRNRSLFHDISSLMVEIDARQAKKRIPEAQICEMLGISQSDLSS